MPGTGKRARNARKRRARAEARHHYPFVVDATVIDLLGHDTLGELAQHLHPVDCQTCGWSIGSTVPSLVVADMIVLANASLHHPRCHPPGRVENFFGGSGEHLVSWHSQSFASGAVPGNPDFGVMLLNPGLETASLRHSDDGWKVNSGDIFRSEGFQDASTSNGEFRVDRPISGASATIDGTTVRIKFADLPMSYEADCSGMIKDLVEARGGLLLAITSCVDPQLITAPDQMESALKHESTVMGWVLLDGEPRPMTPIAAPDSLTTYLLHVGPSHSSISRAVATTEAPLDDTEAKDWAQSTLGAAEGQLDMWRPVTGDGNTWVALDLASARHVMVRRRPDGWQLLQVLKLIGGRHTFTAPEAQAWAAAAIRRGAEQIVGWSEELETPAGFMTWTGTAAPRS